jgi:hypothetical protein
MPADSPRSEHRRTTSILQLGLAGLAGAAVAAIVMIALSASTGTAAMRQGGNTWLPMWVRVVGVVGFAVVVAVHLWHLRATTSRERAWHTGHVVMALGMIDMFASTHRLIVDARIGKLVFAVAVVATLAYVGAVVARGERPGWLWPALAADFAAMVYMFVMPTRGLAWLTGILVAWSVLQAAGWVTGALPARANLGSPRGRSAATACEASRRDLIVRVSLAAMSLGMAYMFAAMAVGMAPMPRTVSIPGMSRM